MNNGLSTLEDEIARLGGDWRKKLRQMAREQKLKDELGILQQPTDTTNQMNAASGSKTGNPKPKGSGGKGATGETAPSSGTAENLFLDSEHNDGE
jgi:capsid protein